MKNTKTQLINSQTGIVHLGQEYIVEHNLTPYVRVSARSGDGRSILEPTPFEVAAAKVFQEEYPDYKTHLAQKVYLNDDNSVSVVLLLQRPMVKEYTEI
jgi:hypothetical protein